MEKLPSNPYFDKIIPPKKQPEKSDALNQYLLNAVENFGSEKLKELEIIKTPEDLALIQFVEQAVDDLLEGYGREKKITVSIDNVHLVSEGGTEQYTEGILSKGGHDLVNKRIIVDRVKSNTEFSLILFHEFLHLKCFSAVQVVEGNKVKTYRSGITSVSRDGKTEYGKNLEEAIISYLTEQFYKTKIQNNDRFKDTEPIISRQNESQQLNHIVDVIFKQHQETFANREDVLKLFINAQVNGNLFAVVRLIKETFGIEDIKKAALKF